MIFTRLADQGRILEGFAGNLINNCRQKLTPTSFDKLHAKGIICHVTITCGYARLLAQNAQKVEILHTLRSVNSGVAIFGPVPIGWY